MLGDHFRGLVPAHHALRDSSGKGRVFVHHLSLGIRQRADLEPNRFRQEHHPDVVQIDRCLELCRVYRFAAAVVCLEGQSQQAAAASLEQRRVGFQLQCQALKKLQVAGIAVSPCRGLGHELGLRAGRPKAGDGLDQGDRSHIHAGILAGAQQIETVDQCLETQRIQRTSGEGGLDRQFQPVKRQQDRLGKQRRKIELALTQAHQQTFDGVGNSDAEFKAADRRIALYRVQGTE